MAGCRDVGRLLQDAGRLVEYARHIDSWHYRLWEPHTTQFLLPYMTGTTFFLQGSGLGGGYGLTYNPVVDQWHAVLWDERSHEERVEDAFSDLTFASRVALFNAYCTNVRVPGVENLYQMLKERGVHPSIVVEPYSTAGLLKKIISRDDPSVWAITEKIDVEVFSQLFSLSLDEVVDLLLAGLPGAPGVRRYRDFVTDDPMAAASVADVLAGASAVGGSLRNLVDAFRGRDIGEQVAAGLTGGGWCQAGDVGSPWLIWVDGQVFRAGRAGEEPPADGSGFPGFATLAQARRFVLWRFGSELRERSGLPGVDAAIAGLGSGGAFRVEAGADGSSVLVSTEDAGVRSFVPGGLDPGLVANVVAMLDARLLDILVQGA